MEEPSPRPQTSNPKPRHPETAPPPAKPAPETVPPPPPQPMPPPVEVHEVKKRKHENVGFQSTSYFKIRAIIKDLRPFFIEVLQAPDFRNNKAAQQIKKQMEAVIELTKQLREAAPSDKPDKQPFAEMNKTHTEGKQTSRSQVFATEMEAIFKKAHPTAPARSISDQMMKRVAEEKITGTSISDQMMKRTAEEKITATSISDQMTHRAAEEKITSTQECGKVMEDGCQGTYKVGGSPIGWNFVLYPSNDPVFYGVTKANILLRRAG